MPNEATVKKTMVKSVIESGGYARRIEDQFNVGVYDLILIPRGLPVFLAEVKIIRGVSFGPSPRQYIELGRVEHAAQDSGHVFPIIVGWREGNYYFSKPANNVKYTDCFSITSSVMSFNDQLVKYYHFLRSKQ